MAGNTVYFDGLQTVTFSLNEQSLTDTLSYTTADNYAKINDAVNGDYYNYHFRFKVSDFEKKGAIQTCNCMADIDELLYSQLNYTLGKNKQSYLTEHMFKIGALLGKEVIFNAENFKLAIDTHQENITYADLIRNLIGWTARVPHIMINCHLMGDKLYVSQRGKEINIVDLSETGYTEPTVKHSIERVTWGSTPDSKTIITQQVPGFLLVPKVSDDIDPGTTFMFDDDHLVKESLINNATPPQKALVRYHYRMKKNSSKFLFLEEEMQYERANDSEPSSVKQTFHNSLGQGQLVTTVYENGLFVGSMVSHTNEDDSDSGWISKRNWTRTSSEETIEKTIAGSPLIDTEFPLEREDQLSGIAEALRWLNRKTKEIVTMNVYNLEHVITFEDLVKFNGADYFLQSNTVTNSEPNHILNQQTLNLVRWF